MKKIIVACCSLLIVNSLSARLPDSVQAELAEIVALKASLDKRAEFFRAQETSVAPVVVRAAVPADRFRDGERNSTLQDRLEDLRDQHNDASDVSHDTALTRAERKDAKLKADLTRYQQEKELTRENVKKNFILIKDIQSNLPDAQLRRGFIGKIEFFADKRLNKKGSLKSEVFRNESGGIDALVELKKTGVGAFVKLPLDGAGKSVFVQFMQEGDRMGTGKEFMLMHPDKMLVKSPVELAEVKKNDTVFEGVLIPVN